MTTAKGEVASSLGFRVLSGIRSGMDGEEETKGENKEGLEIYSVLDSKSRFRLSPSVVPRCISTIVPP